MNFGANQSESRLIVVPLQTDMLSGRNPKNLKCCWKGCIGAGRIVPTSEFRFEASAPRPSASRDASYPSGVHRYVLYIQYIAYEFFRIQDFNLIQIYIMDSKSNASAVSTYSIIVLPNKSDHGIKFLLRNVLEINSEA